MSASHVLVETLAPFTADARKLLKAAELEPVQRLRYGQRILLVLHQIGASEYRTDPDAGADSIARRVQDIVNETTHRHHNRRIVFCLPEMPDADFVRVYSRLSATPDLPTLDIVHTVSSAVVRLLDRLRSKPEPDSPPALLDKIPGIDTLSDDLRDNESGRLNAKKIAALFGLTLTAIAKAAGMSKQALDQTPDSEKAQPLLKRFEQVARLRAHPQFTDPAALRKWFRRPLPLFSNHSAEELFEAGKLDHVALKVDQLLTGDFGG